MCGEWEDRKVNRMQAILSRLDIGSGLAMSALRIVTGGLLAWHGYRKFADGLDGFQGFLDFLELPATGLLAVVVALIELVGGIALMLGIFTRPVAAIIAVEFALITFWVKLVKLDAVLLTGGEQPGVELDLLFLFASLFFLAAGPGPLSLDRMLGIEANTGAASPSREPAMAG